MISSKTPLAPPPSYSSVDIAYANILADLDNPTQASSSTNPGRICFNCNAISTPLWLKNPLDKNQDECQKCYNAALSALAKSGNSGKTC